MKNAFLLVHSHDSWAKSDKDHLDIHKELLATGKYVTDWTCKTGAIQPGDEVFMIRLGNAGLPRGIVGHGVAISGQHARRLRSIGKAVDVEFDWLCLVGPPVVPFADLEAIPCPQLWSSQQSGIAIRPAAAMALRRLWRRATTDIRLVKIRAA
jgi:hypothetical protein